jgi:hypothetical protein
MTEGERAEQLVEARLRAALDPAWRLYANVRWTGAERPGGPPRDGEADLVLAHPELGLIVIETKAGTPSRDAQGHWFLGGIALDRSPFEQAMTSKHQLVDQLRRLPDWPPHTNPLAGHAVALPSVDLASLARGHTLLGPDADARLVLDASALESTDATRRWLAALLDFWRADGTRGDALGPAGMAQIDSFLAPNFDLRRLVKGKIADDAPVLLEATADQQRVMRAIRSMRQLEIVGPAGSGKSMLVAARARDLATQGYRTLVVCFNQRLAASLQADLADVKAPGGIDVRTFHRLCEVLGAKARTLPKRPTPIPQDWWDETLPAAPAAAIERLPDERFHAILVDEGQDLARPWFTLLRRLLQDPDDVFWVVHDPGQALRTPDVVAELRLPRYELFENLRNPGSVAKLSARFYRGASEVVPAREEKGRHRIQVAEPGEPTLERLRLELHRLVHEEQVPPWQIAVLSGVSARESTVWRQRRFGNEVLVNEALEDDGTSKGLASNQLPEEPDEVLFESIRRFKGLEREVTILVELPESGERLDELLYVGMTRATTELVVITPPGLAKRFR